ncbi:diguanylate cyclase [uncultured Xylophilus sp.]|uniref:GGDEF domain-containing protein n=1 Tax=uncultured Xylophilus sp. TaxID=296832 RepID=UPI0025DF31AB|nr:diguanylate cyclase [uncultured Xylophilus sp.]
MSSPRTRSLATRLTLATLAFCLLFTAVTVAVRTVWAWHHNIAEMAAELSVIARMYEGPLAKVIWDLDRDQVSTYAASLVESPAVGRATISVRMPAGPPLLYPHARPGWAPSGHAPSHRIALTYEPYAGGAETVGELVLEGDERTLWQTLRAEWGAIVLTQAVQSLLLASLVMLLFSRLVTVHVRRIAHHLAEIGPTRLDRTLRLDRRQASRDELTLLVDGINDLQDKLSGHLQRQHRYEQELAGHRDRLRAMVQERTTELEAANRQLEALSRTDPLTGLANRRQFDEAKQLEFQRARRSGRPLSLLLCDVDHFKRYNDLYGHHGGDATLQAVADALRNSARRSGDLVARIGGEEFAVLLPDTPPETARDLAERLRRAVAELGIEHQGADTTGRVTVSIGTASLDPRADADFDALFHRADQALYRAKRAGRDQVAQDLSDGASALRMLTHDDDPEAPPGP